MQVLWGLQFKSVKGPERPKFELDYKFFKGKIVSTLLYSWIHSS